MTIYFTRLIDWAAGTKYRAQDFDAEFDNVSNAFELVGAQIDAAALSVTTAGSNTTSTTSNSIGTGSKTWTVETSKSLVVGMHYKMADTASPSNWALGLITAYNSSTGSLTITVSDISGSGTITAWAGSVSAPITRSVTRRALVGAGTVVAPDNGGWIDATTGSWTLAWDAVATLGAGFCVIVRNSGTGDITHDFNSAETCDGLATFVQYPGEVRMFLGDASALRSIVLSGFNKTFTASGTFTKPPGYQRFAGQLWGGGGGGRKDTNNTTGRYGGGGGACALFDFPSSSFGATEAVTIGSGGVAQTSTASGGNGGDSSVGSLVSAFGGLGGTNGSAIGGSAYTSGVTVIGQNGYINGCTTAGGIQSQTVLGGAAAGAASNRTVYGGGGGGSIASDDSTLYSPTTFAPTVFGGAGGESAVASSGADGTVPGGGGGATKSGTTSGAGARGELRIWGVV